MEIVKPGYEILAIGEDPRLMERVIRTCYKSEDRISEDGSSAIRLITNCRERGHTAMLEFGDIWVRFVCDRGVSHELVRHRLASFAQESTRYCDYGGKGIAVICPSEIGSSGPAYEEWSFAVRMAENAYNILRKQGFAPQIARAVLPTCTKTEIVVKADFTEWRHIFSLRTAKPAHPQMRELMTPLLHEVATVLPHIFGDMAEAVKE